MGKFADRAKRPDVEQIHKTCGVEFCENKCDHIIGYNKVARCSYHYQRDVDSYCGKRQSASAFVFEKGMMRS